ncbi:hypothetical protein DFJ63DRAFT_333265 [Scheffersomyces coipomensis]|uniref:uncharacterized protein n=1 Tax=Scheffersomyces coipomensis TaxID=1788519 RepID=UPI00315D9266
MDIPPSYASVIGNSSESAGVPIETQNIDLNRARLIVRQQEDLIELVMAITSIESTLNILHDEIRKRDSAAQEVNRLHRRGHNPFFNFNSNFQNIPRSRSSSESAVNSNNPHEILPIAETPKEPPKTGFKAAVAKCFDHSISLNGGADGLKSPKTYSSDVSSKIMKQGSNSTTTELSSGVTYLINYLNTTTSTTTTTNPAINSMSQSGEFISSFDVGFKEL